MFQLVNIVLFRVVSILALLPFFIGPYAFFEQLPSFFSRELRAVLRLAYFPMLGFSSRVAPARLVLAPG